MSFRTKILRLTESNSIIHTLCLSNMYEVCKFYLEEGIGSLLKLELMAIVHKNLRFINNLDLRETFFGVH
jgi:hypothetical protein